MFLKKTYKYRLKLTRRTEALCYQFAGARRWVYNHGLAARKEAFEATGTSPSLFDQNNELVALKAKEETGWLKNMHSQVLQQALHDLDGAFQHFFRRVQKKEEKPGYPKFQCKGESDSFRYPQGVKINQDRVWLPKIGWVRFKKSREITGTIKQTTVLLEAGKWYVCFSCEIAQEVKSVVVGDLVGVDMGLESYAAFSTLTRDWKEENPRFLKSQLAHLRFLSRQLSQKVKRSKNYQKAKARLRVFHASIRHKREDFLHKLTTRLVKNHDGFAVETLNVKGLLQSGWKGMARSISDAGWRSFLGMLKYKCVAAGKSFTEVDRFFPSSQLCASCNGRYKLPLSQREYVCACGYRQDRDINAAKNIRAAGMSVLKACGAACISGSCEAGILRL